MPILIACAECGSQTSSAVDRCPRCGGNPGPSMCRICCRQDKSAALNLTGASGVLTSGVTRLGDFVSVRSDIWGPGSGVHDTCLRDFVSAHPDVRQFSCPTCSTTFDYDLPLSHIYKQETDRWPCSICGQPIHFGRCCFCGGTLIGGRHSDYRDMHASCRPASVRFEQARKAVMKQFYAEVWSAADLCPECGGESYSYSKEEGFFRRVKWKEWTCRRCHHTWR